MFLLYYLLAVVILALVTVPAYRSHQSKWNSLHTMRGSLYLSQARFFFANELEKILSDVLFLNRLETLDRFLETEGGADSQAVEHLLSRFAAVYGRYHQVRLLSDRGRELLRIDYRDGSATTVPASELRDRSETRYFRKALTTKPDQIYVFSPRVLGAKGKADPASTPALRMIVSKYDQQGSMLGVLVLDYDLQRLFEMYRNLVSFEPSQQALLVTETGQVIFHTERSSRQLLQDPVSYRDQYPEVWRVLTQQESGEVAVEDGIAFFSDLTAINRYKIFNYTEGLTSDTIQVENLDQSWRLILFMPDELLSGYDFFNQPWIKPFYLALLLLLAFLVGVIVKYRLARLRLRQRDRRLTEEHRRLYEEAPCGYLSIDREDNIIRVNRTFLEWIDYTESELVSGTRLEELIAITSLHTFADMLNELETSGYTSDVSINVVRKDNTLLPVTISGRTNCDGEGNIVTIDLSVMDATDRKRIESLLSLQASTDELTGLKNRRAFFDLARVEWARSTRYRRPLTLLLLDVDNFKAINDTHGHPRGDQVLKLISKAVTKSLRRDTACARYGGDEFIALLPETGLEDSRVLAERFRQLVEEARVTTDTGEEVRVSISLGIATRSPEDKDIADLIRKADEALYRAKEAGRNRVVLYRRD